PRCTVYCRNIAPRINPATTVKITKANKGSARLRSGGSVKVAYPMMKTQTKKDDITKYGKMLNINTDFNRLLSLCCRGDSKVGWVNAVAKATKAKVVNELKAMDTAY